MLESLSIRQFALIDNVTIRFHSGMHVLTGETGAGKSIVVDSVNLVLGGRADRDMIRTGSDRASVEAVFNTECNMKVRNYLEKEEIEYDGQTLTIYREISSGGKNICRICGVIVPLGKLKELASLIMDLHGQSDQQFLADSDKQLAFLDQTGNKVHSELLIRTEQQFEQFMNNHRTYAKLVRQNENREDRINSLKHDLEQLRKANVRRGEMSRLLEYRKQLEESEKQEQSLHAVLKGLSGGESDVSLLSHIKESAAGLKKLAEKDDSYKSLSERCESAYYELEEIAYQVSQLSSQCEKEPGAIEKVEDRMDLIHRLERKYSSDADNLPDILTAAEKEFLHLTELEEQIHKMSAEHKSLLAAYRSAAKELSASRQKLANEFAHRMEKELSDLGMPDTQFQVRFIPNDTGRPLMPSPQGDDRIEFMFSPNPGEPLKPLARIASGGELSRLMLAVKTLESSHTGVESMVFDEIDTGISGRMAQVVAEKLISISRDKQVICVTHLPQIAAAADFHYLVSKSVSEGRTNTSVFELEKNGRTEELGRMISGADGITPETRSYAEKLLQAAEIVKNVH